MRRRISNERSLAPLTWGTKMALGAMTATLVVMVARPSSAAVTFQQTIPQTITFIDPCNGHTLVGTGTSQVVVTKTYDSSGGFHMHVHVNEQEFKDIDLTTGAVCADTTTFNESGLNFDFDSLSATGLPTVIAVKFNGNALCGSEGGVKFALLVHYTINPDGTITAVTDNPVETTCIKNGG
jgi:hypothetical protein